MGELTRVGNVVLNVYEEIEASYYNGGFPASAIKTDIEALDNITLGVSKSDLITIAGTTFSHQRTLALNIATNLFLQNKPILFFEMSYRTVWETYASILGSRVDNPFKINHSNFDCRERAGVEIDQIIEEIEAFAQCNPNGVVFIDAFHLLNRKKDFAFDDVSVWNFSSRLKNLTRKLNLPIILVVDISARNPRYRYNNLDMNTLFLHDELNEDSDKVIIVDQADVENNESDYQSFYINVAKNKFGRTGLCELMLELTTSRILTPRKKALSKAI